MLLEFSVSNFGSFRDENVLSLIANRRLKRVPGWLLSTSSLKKNHLPVLSAAVIYGANASGKSTLVRALAFLSRYVEEGTQASKPNSSTRTIPFKLDDISEGNPSSFRVVFCHENLLFEYRVSMSSKRITHESLDVKSDIFVGTFERTFQKKRNLYTWKQTGLLESLDLSIREKTRDNILFLAVAAEFNQDIPKIAYDWFSNYLAVLDLQAIRRGVDPTHTANMSLKNPNLKSKITSLLQRADLGIVDFSVSDQSKKPSKIEFGDDVPPEVAEYLAAQITERELLEVTFTHKGSKGSGKPVPIRLGLQSAGTQRLFAIAGPILDVLANGLTLVVDEIDASMHPALVRSLLSLFASDEANKSGAQLICTTHDTTLLDKNWLRRDQIWFCEKSDEGASSLYSLNDFPAVKNESYERGYLAGRYGATPNIARSLVSLQSGDSR